MSAAWRVTGVAEAGTRHLERGQACEDALAHWSDDAGGVLVLAVADGVGSARFGAAGARRAVDVVVEACRHRVPAMRRGRLDNEARWTEFLRFLLHAVRLELERAAAAAAPDRPDASPAPVGADELPQVVTLDELVLPLGDATGRARPVGVREFATTLLVAVVTETWLACLQVGDGVIVGRRGGEFVALTRPAKGEYVNVAPFVTDDHYAEEMQVSVVRDHGMDAIALLTDGLERLAMTMSDNRPHGPFFGSLFAFAADEAMSTAAREAALAHELRSDKVNRLTDDDKTLLVAVRLREAEVPSEPPIEPVLASAVVPAASLAGDA